MSKLYNKIDAIDFTNILSENEALDKFKDDNTKYCKNCFNAFEGEGDTCDNCKRILNEITDEEKDIVLVTQEVEDYLPIVGLTDITELDLEGQKELISDCLDNYYGEGEWSKDTFNAVARELGLSHLVESKEEISDVQSDISDLNDEIEGLDKIKGITRNTKTKLHARKEIDELDKDLDRLVKDKNDDLNNAFGDNKLRGYTKEDLTEAIATITTVDNIDQESKDKETIKKAIEIAGNKTSINNDTFRDLRYKLANKDYDLVDRLKDYALVRGEDVIYTWLRDEDKNLKESVEPSFVLTDIEWETDGEDANLPTSTTIPISKLDIEDLEDDGEVEEALNNYLSDSYGWLTNGYSYELKESVNINIADGNVSVSTENTNVNVNPNNDVNVSTDNVVADVTADNINVSVQDTEPAIDLPVGDMEGTIENPIEPVEGEPVEEPVEEPAEELPAEEPVEEPKEEPVLDQPVEEPVENEVEESALQVNDIPAKVDQDEKHKRIELAKMESEDKVSYRISYLNEDDEEIAGWDIDAEDDADALAKLDNFENADEVADDLLKAEFVSTGIDGISSLNYKNTDIMLSSDGDENIITINQDGEDPVVLKDESFDKVLNDLMYWVIMNMDEKETSEPESDSEKPVEEPETPETDEKETEKGE